MAVVATALTRLVISLTAAEPTAGPSLTIYNQQFGVVRDTIELDLKPGVNEVVVSDLTAHVEPSSLVLRDPAGRRQLRILEQNYRADPLTEGLLLNRFEGQEIDFLTQAPGHNLNSSAAVSLNFGDIQFPSSEGGKGKIVRGRIVRSGYVPHNAAFQRYESQYYLSQVAMASPSAGAGSPIIEVAGKLRFSLPGIPLFPSLGDDTILKPTLHWRLETDEPGAFEAELSYITGGMTWGAAYNAIAPEEGDTLELVGWVTIDNQSGKTFPEARIKLMAGDVSRVQREQRLLAYGGGGYKGGSFGEPEVTERAFDEYHLYTLPRPTTLRDRETKQVEFVRARGVQSRRLYVYDGVVIDPRRYGGWSSDMILQNSEYGTEWHTKVAVMREFENSKTNHLGIPLPRGTARFYRQDEDGSLQFTGENLLDHTPQGEPVRITTGNAFDLVGERKRTNFRGDHSGRGIDPVTGLPVSEELRETFEIRLRNRKPEPAEIQVIEHLYRWKNWVIVDHSHDFKKTEAQTIEFPVVVAPDQEQVITYTVLYTW